MNQWLQVACNTVQNLCFLSVQHIYQVSAEHSINFTKTLSEASFLLNSDNSFMNKMWQLLIFSVLSCSVVSSSLGPRGTVVHQAPLSIQISRQEYWSGLPFPSPKINILVYGLNSNIKISQQRVHVAWSHSKPFVQKILIELDDFYAVFQLHVSPITKIICILTSPQSCLRCYLLGYSSHLAPDQT